VTDPLTQPATDLVALGAEVEWTDMAAGAEARSAGLTGAGRLVDLVEWLAATQGRFPPRALTRPRCVTAGTPSAAVRTIAADLGIGLATVTLADDATIGDALAAGVACADDEVDAGTDLLIVIDADFSLAAAVLVALLTGAEPVALLPRGAAAVDTVAWIERAGQLRDTRRRVADLRNRPDDLLAALAHPPLAATVGLVLRAAARRTPIVLDGAGAVAAALLGHDVQVRAGRWWRVADSAADPVQARAAAELLQEPLLGLASAGGVAGLLSLPLLRAAITLAAAS
jgi:nicotinate-nucleotide--dimethylbenzimidazole phosphoribosyltransferase